VRDGISRDGAVEVPIFTTASVDAVIDAHPVDWEQLCQSKYFWLSDGSSDDERSR
jgi:hypothetical protein